VTWTARDSNRQWSSVASSADGTKLVAAVQNGQIYTSTDSGVTWTARAGSLPWSSVASSADGTKLVAGDYYGQIYTSMDSGVTWTAQASGQDWYSVASSVDGNKLVAAAGADGKIYTCAGTVTASGPQGASEQFQYVGNGVWQPVASASKISLAQLPANVIINGTSVPSAIALGANTIASGTASTAMGWGSIASSNASTAMGYFSKATNQYATAMGYGTLASGDSSTAMGSGTTASALVATAMGWGNTASGVASTAMGQGTTASGADATAMGGNTVAAGNQSVAMGYVAQALHNGSFVWSDSSSATPFSSTAANQFCVRAAGGVNYDNSTSVYFGNNTRQMLNLWSNLFGIGIQDNALYFRSTSDYYWYQGGTHNNTQGNSGGGSTLMHLSASELRVNGTFVSASDRNVKQDFAPVNSKTVLDKVAALPITTWKYKSDATTPHLGPMAQDFYAAFNLGSDDKHIAVIDESGVALAAIQGLNEKLEEQKVENAELKKNSRN
jgi:hypothetical protein